MRYFKGAEAKVVSAFKALPLDAMKDMIDKRQAIKDKADDNYSILKASLEADVLPVDQPRYLKIKQSFYSAIDELSNSNLSPEQSARVAVALNTQLRNEMTNGFIAQAVGNKQRILEHREELRKKAKDLNLNYNEIEQFIKAGENEFIQGGGSMDPERGVFRNYEGLNPVKRTDYNKYGRDFAAAVKTGSIERVNQVLQDYGMYGKKIGNSSKFSGFSNKLELQQFLKSPESLRDAYVNAIMSNPEHIQALQQDFELGYHRQYGKDWKQALYNMAGNTMQDLSYFDAQFGHSEDQSGMYDRRRQLDDRNYEEQKLNRVPMINTSKPLHQLGVKLSNDPNVLSSVLQDAMLQNPLTEHGKALRATIDQQINTVFNLAKQGKMNWTKADDEIQGIFKAFGLEGGSSKWTRGFGNMGVFDKSIQSRQQIYDMFTPDKSVLSKNPESYAKVLQALQANNNLTQEQRVDFTGWGVDDIGQNLFSSVLNAKKNVTATGKSKFMQDNEYLTREALGLKENQSIGGLVYTNNGTFASIKTKNAITNDEGKVLSYEEKEELMPLNQNNMSYDQTQGQLNPIFNSQPSQLEQNQYNQYLPSISWEGKGTFESIFPTTKP